MIRIGIVPKIKNVWIFLISTIFRLNGHFWFSGLEKTGSRCEMNDEVFLQPQLKLFAGVNHPQAMISCRNKKTPKI